MWEEHETLGLSEERQLSAQTGLGFEECAEEGESLTAGRLFGSATRSDVWQLGVRLAANGELCLHRGPLGRCLKGLSKKIVNERFLPPIQGQQESTIWGGERRNFVQVSSLQPMKHSLRWKLNVCSPRLREGPFL